MESLQNFISSNSTGIGSDDTNQIPANNKDIIGSSSDEKEKKTRNRPDKKTRYHLERQNLIKELNEIIGITENNKSVLLYDIERNEKLKDKLRELVPEIKRIYKCGTWGYFKEEIKGGGNEITLMRSIYNDSDYEITTKQKIIERGNKKIRNTQYHFNMK